MSVHNNSSGKPGTSLGTLTQQGSIPSSEGAVRFNASASGISLSSGTTYWVVIDVSVTAQTYRNFRVTTDSEDPGGATGWSIGNDHITRGTTATDWSTTLTDSHSLAVDIYGYAKTAPTVANPIPDQAAGTGTAFSYAFPANTFADADGDTLTYTARKGDGTALPSWLTFTGTTRTFSGTPASGDVGTVSVKVTASDGTNSVSDTFDIVVRANSAPTVANPIPDQMAAVGVFVEYLIPDDTFNDADGDTLTYTATKADGTALPTWISIIGRAIFWNPTAAEIGTHSIKVTASDGIASESDTFDLVVRTNSAPTVANPIPDQTATVGTAFSYAFPANTFNDADTGDALTYTATQPSNSPLPSWLTFDAATRTFSGTPAAGNTGNYRITVTASDGIASVSDTFDIMVAAGPTVTGVAISSTPSLDTDNNGTPETYGLTEKIRVKLTFSEAVTVTGTPRLTIKMDPNFGEKQADYETGSGFTELFFAYTVVEPNTSTQGIAVLENTLALNGGTIRAGTVDASLTHAGVAHDAGHKVDWQRTGTPEPTPDPPQPPQPGGAPTARAGADRSVAPGATVTLSGSGTDSGGTIQSYAWSQVSGTSVTLTNANTARASFTAPDTAGALVFRLTVTDNSGDTGTDDVTVTVRDGPPRFAGGVRPQRLEPGEAMTPVVLPAAEGGNGGPTAMRWPRNRRAWRGSPSMRTPACCPARRMLSGGAGPSPGQRMTGTRTGPPAMPRV